MAAVIDAEQASWIVQGGPSISVASCDPARGPSLGQAIGCRIDAKRQRLTLFMAEPRNVVLLADLRANREIAVVFTHSFNLRSLQLKAKGAREVALQPGDEERIMAHIGAVALQWAQVGKPESFTRSVLTPAAGTVFAFELTPHVAFDQSPGPRAGTPL